MSNKKKIVIFSTGGTILCDFIPGQKAVLPARRGGDLLRQIPGLDQWVEINIVEPFQLPSPYLTVEHGLQLSEEIEQYLSRQEYEGAVVLQGTDTLEEMAYLVHLTLRTNKPVVFTGAMKSNGELYCDALGNIAAALQVASTDEAQGRGVLVVMNQEIHGAVHVSKTHSESVASFQSPQFGPLGRISMDEVVFYTSIDHAGMADKGRYQRQVEQPVLLLKAYLGMEPGLIRLARETGIKGLVIEAFGAGNLHPAVAAEAAVMVQHGIPVVIATRCRAGRALPLYAYEGGGKILKEAGLILGGGLSGVKCRLKLMLALGNQLNPHLEF